MSDHCDYAAFKVDWAYLCLLAWSLRMRGVQVLTCRWTSFSTCVLHRPRKVTEPQTQVWALFLVYWCLVNISNINIWNYKILCFFFQLCATARVVPESYLDFKRILITECNKTGYLRLMQARNIIKIDVNKTRKIYDFLLQEGHINKDRMWYYVWKSVLLSTEWKPWD